MELFYKGKVRKLINYQMVSTSFGNRITKDKLNQKVTTPIEDAYIVIHSANEERIDFSFFFFDKETKYLLHEGDTIKHKHEGNAFAFELTFTYR